MMLSGEQNFSRYVTAGIIALCGYFGKVMFSCLSTTISHTATYYTLRDLRENITAKLARVPMGTILDTPSGQYKTTIVDRVEGMESTFAHLIPEMTANVLVPLVIAVYLFLLDWRMALLSLVTLVVGLVVMSAGMKNYPVKWEGAVKAGKQMADAIVEYIGGIEVVKAFSQSAGSYKKYSDAVNYNANYYVDWMRENQKTMSAYNAILPSVLICVLPCGFAFWLSGSLELSTFLSIVIFSLGLIGPIIAAFTFTDDLAVLGTNVEEISQLLNAEELNHKETPIKLEDTGISLRSVSFSYDGTTEVLHDVNLAIHPGTMTALVGPSGSGKSTVAKLIAGYWDVTSGSITLGGHELKDMPLSEIADQISYVSQDNYLFNRSIRENIRMGRPSATDAEVEQAAKQSGCDAFIRKLDNGYRLRYIPMGYFNKNSIGNITAIVTTTLDDVENSAARVLVSVLGGFFNSVALVIVLLVFDWRIGLVAAAGVLIYLAAAELALRKSAALSGVRQHTQESLVESVLEYIQGMGIVKAFGLERDSTQSIGSAIKANCRDNLKLTKASVPYDAIKQAVVRVFSVLLLLASVWFWLDGSLPLAYGLILVIASFMVFNDLENAGNMASLLQMLAASMDTANSIDDTPVMDEKGADITPKSSEIVFDKVDFSYADRKILDQVSFTIPEKTTTAIVGPSGAGKTTMCNLIARFWDVNAGKITIGGTDVRDFKLDSLMKNISMVFQSVYLFADTIENNIKFGCPDATHEQVVEAAKKACCHNFISALPDGYDTVIGEGGGTLSGGEKQRISIARAMLKDAPIIILDEATSSVDPENEDELQRAIEALTHDKTIIMIAHRLKTVRNADQILVLDNAHIVQRGTHAELIQQKGLYADFVSARQEAIGWKLAQ